MAVTRGWLLEPKRTKLDEGIYLGEQETSGRYFARGGIGHCAVFFFTLGRLVILRLVMTGIVRMLLELLVRHTDPKTAQAANIRTRQLHSSDAFKLIFMLTI